VCNTKAGCASCLCLSPLKFTTNLLVSQVLQRLEALGPAAFHPHPDFEKNLLKELGYALTLDREADTGKPVEPQKRYTYMIERGPIALNGRAEALVEVTGRTLLDMACDNFTDSTTLAQSKVLMRFLMNHYLDNQELHTRQLLRELQQI